MWLCSPRKSRCGASLIAATASYAWPVARDRPNFWSSWAVAMYSLPPAWMPDFRRTMTGATTPSVSGDALDLVDLVHRVDEDAVDAGLEGEADFRVGLIVAVQANPRGVHAGAQGEAQFAERGGVDTQALGRDQACDVGAQEGLAGVEGVAAAHAVAVPELLGHRAGPHAGAAAHGLDVEHEGGRAEVGGDAGQVDASHAQHAALPRRAPRPQVGALIGGRAGEGTDACRLAHRVTSSRGRSHQGGRGRCAAPG